MYLSGQLGSITQRMALILIATLQGCGGGDDFGESVTIPQGHRDRLSAAFNGGAPVTLPKDRSFNVADTQRHSQGAAAADSTADDSGRASCSADASRGGRAGAEFQIGHVLTHDGNTPLDVAVTFNVEYRCSVRGDAPGNDAQPIALKAYIKDSNHRMLAKVMLAEGDSDRLPERWSGSQSPSFDLKLEPGLAYHLIVAGSVAVSGDGEHGLRAELEVTRVEIQIAPATE